ncbi:MAG: copper resistance CopC/CopD family protein [Alcaligenes sp.]
MHTQIMRRAFVYTGLPRLIILLMAFTVLVWTPRLYAHASLIASTPNSGAVLQDAPHTVTLSFNESISPLVLKLVRPDGSTEDLKEPLIQNNALELALPALDAHGTYGVSWRVISADGHPVGSTLTFSVGMPSTQTVDRRSGDPLRNSVIWLARLLGYLGLFTGIGWSIYRSQIPSTDQLPAPAGRFVLSALALGAGAVLLNLGLVGVDALDLPLSALFSSIVWKTAATTSMGLAAVLAWLAVLCATLSWQVAHRVGQTLLATLALFLLASSLAASGHASTAEPVWLARPSVWFHVVALTLWIGALLPLAFTLKRGQEPQLLARFSRLIPAALVLLLGSGAALIYVQFDQVSSLWQSAYGQVLSVKLLLVVLLLGLGAYNRHRLSQAVLNQQANARSRMLRVVKVEYLLVVLILAVLALWRFTPPPRALAHVSTPSISAHIHTDAGMADLVYTPASPPQTATLTLSLFEPDFSPLKAQEVEVIFTNPQAGVESITFAAHPHSPNQWEINPLELPHLASWDIRIQVLVSDFKRIRLDTTLELKTPTP